MELRNAVGRVEGLVEMIAKYRAGKRQTQMSVLRIEGNGSGTS
jgi:hypothetical protein